MRRLAGNGTALASLLAQKTIAVASLCLLICRVFVGIGAEEAANPWPLRGERETVGQYALRVGLPEAMTLDIAKDVKLKAVLIPAGTFAMGSPATEEGRSEDEMEHRVTISRPFYLGRYEVTQQEFSLVMGADPSAAKAPSKPVDGASWNDAVEFCKRVTALCKRTVRLPTEAEWEYACRAGTTTPFYTGVSISTKQANYDGYLKLGAGMSGHSRGETMPVASYPPNPWGLYDMHGNVWEYCEDYCDNTYYRRSPAVDPKCVEPAKELSGARCVRGGSWYLCAPYCRSASRGAAKPEEGGEGQIGFRVAIEVGAAQETKRE
jgi:formylglycine-generating enzyme required for sulfatase activity